MRGDKMFMIDVFDKDLHQTLEAIINGLKENNFEVINEYDLTKPFEQTGKPSKIKCSVIEFIIKISDREVPILISVVKEKNRVLVTIPNLRKNLERTVLDKNEVSILESQLKNIVSTSLS
jgi:uncharacterized protein (DUF302 family)